MPDNPFGEEFRKRFKALVGNDNWECSVTYSEMEPEDRIGMSLAEAARRPCFEYHPEPFPVAPPEAASR